ncbi:MAG: cardiolipin synthase [Butyrivibrio sp.]|nr:cardiolipin synthase [Butyrivibrio sp.]
MGSSKLTTEKKRYVGNGVKRLIFAGIAVIVNVIWIYNLIVIAGRSFTIFDNVVRIVALLLIIQIYGKQMNAALKMPWMILIGIFPILGMILYFSVGLSGSTKNMRKRFEKIDTALFQIIPQDKAVAEELKNKDMTAYSQSSYLFSYTGFPVYNNTSMRYYSNALAGLEAQLEDMNNAKSFIFMEYHAIEVSQAFERIEEVLARKAREGVEVRLFYDDVGSIGFINRDFVNRMEEEGIHCRCFNPVIPLVNVFLNNRDHRKITVIDGRIGYTGGYNLADEYFGYKHPYGEWKDTGVRLEGEAVHTLTAVFLEMWNAIRATDKDDKNAERFFPECEPMGYHGFIQPYADSPLDHENVGENVYLNLLGSANEYIYFMTPYLIIDDEMINAFTLAAKRGVDVRIITPGIPDKKAVNNMTKSYYSVLCQSGVRIYEYTPGFCHAKMCICDDKMATCGTINLDYRSFYHHFENGVWMYDSEIIKDIRKDFEATFKECHEVTEAYRHTDKRRVMLYQYILRLVAPLL